MRTLAEQVAAWEHDIPVEALNSTQRQRVYIFLYHNHLPKLAEHNNLERAVKHLDITFELAALLLTSQVELEYEVQSGVEVRA